MASLKLGTIVLQGEMKSALLDGNSNHYDMERGYTRHSITSPEDPGILIKLGSQCIVNHIQLLLWDKDLRYENVLVSIFFLSHEKETCYSKIDRVDNIVLVLPCRKLETKSIF